MRAWLRWTVTLSTSTRSAAHVVRREEHDATLAAVVRSTLGDIPWSRARALCATGRVLVDGCIATDAASRVLEGQTVEIHPDARKLKAGALPDDAIVYVDRDVVVVRKPAGVMTVPFEPGEKDTLVDLARTALRRRESKNGKKARFDPELGVVQRLDKDTTGLVVFTRTLAAKRDLAQQFRVHSIDRHYFAIVHGEARDATYETQLIQNRGDGLRGSYGVFRKPKGPPPKDAQRAVTHVETLERLRGATLVRCRLETGRQHQIRIHMAEAGTPLVGEPVYIRDYQGPLIPAPRPMLHAAFLGLDLPGGEPLELEDPPPDDFVDVYESLRVRPPRR